MERVGAPIIGFGSDDQSQHASRDERRRAALSVALEVTLLVSCFAFAVYSTQAAPDRPAGSVVPTQQSKNPTDASRFSTPPVKQADKSLVRVG